MANGETKLLRDLQAGDRVLAMNADRKIVEDEVILMLDSQPKRPGEKTWSVLLRTFDPSFSSVLLDWNRNGPPVEFDRQPFHCCRSSGCLPSCPSNQSAWCGFHPWTGKSPSGHCSQRLWRIPSRILHTNDRPRYIHCLWNETSLETVANPPLGTLIVNGMAASCYSSVVSHDLAHYMLAPLRWWYQLAKFFAVKQPFESAPEAGMHWIPQTMLQITEKYLPSVLTTQSW